MDRSEEDGGQMVDREGAQVFRFAAHFSLWVDAPCYWNRYKEKKSSFCVLRRNGMLSISLAPRFVGLLGGSG